MTNVLIPTDFSVHSLNLICTIPKLISGKLNIFLFHAFDMPESLLDAFQRKGIRNHNNLITEELRLRSRQIKIANPEIANISFRIMYGSSLAAFNNFAEANNIQAIMLPETYAYFPVVRESVDPTKMILRSGIQIIQDTGNKTRADSSPPLTHYNTGSAGNSLLAN
jgi:hypothetical protein